MKVEVKVGDVWMYVLDWAGSSHDYLRGWLVGWGFLSLLEIRCGMTMTLVLLG
jgi:hypothetical protein